MHVLRYVGTAAVALAALVLLVTGLGQHTFAQASGLLVYISNTGSDEVWVVDMDSEAVVAVVSVGNDPRGIDIAPDNSRVYVANRFGNSVSVIDTATNSVVKTIDLDAVTATEPYDVVVSPDGSQLYVAMKNGGSENGDGTVAVVDLPAGDVVAEAILDSDASPEGIVVTPGRAESVRRRTWRHVHRGCLHSLQPGVPGDERRRRARVGGVSRWGVGLRRGQRRPYQ